VTGSLSLRDPAARDAAVVGWKAALLSAAAAAGLPVLPGVVLPLVASARAVAAGSEVLPAAGRAAAYLAASSVEPDPADLEVLGRIAAEDDTVVVRSSTPSDDDGRWSGAFASYLDVRADELPAAVRGCWSSVFARDALERCEATGTDPGSIRIAVLVQPSLSFTFGGTANVVGDPGEVSASDVRVTVATGGAVGVVGGAEGSTVVVGPEGGSDGVAVAPASVLAEVAAIAREAAALTGIGTIEWGATGERVVLLQIGPAQPRASAAEAAATHVRAAAVPRGARRVASIVARFRGALADELVLPWALGAELPSDVAPTRVEDAASALVDARARADRLVARAWGLPAGEARRSADAAIHALRGGEVADGLAALARTRAPVPAEARALLGLVLGLGEALTDGRVLTAPELVWQLTASELDDALRGSPAAPRGGPDRWEGFLADVAFAHGAVIGCTPITDGVGAGRLHVISGLTDIGRPGPRMILAAKAPLPQLAPLLWHCAGFVARGGSAGAHLFEVARSLGVPAVIGVSLSDLGPPGSLVAVDGSAGEVASLDGARSRTRRPA